jgi:hypothetical protein
MRLRAWTNTFLTSRETASGKAIWHSGLPVFIRLRNPRSFTILKGRLVSDTQRTISALPLQSSKTTLNRVSDIAIYGGIFNNIAATTGVQNGIRNFISLSVWSLVLNRIQKLAFFSNTVPMVRCLTPLSGWILQDGTPIFATLSSRTLCPGSKVVIQMRR